MSPEEMRRRAPGDKTGWLKLGVALEDYFRALHERGDALERRIEKVEARISALESAPKK